MIHYAVLTAVFVVLNPFWRDRLEMIYLSQQLTLLKRLSLSCFNFPRWQSVCAVSLIGLLIGLDPTLRAAPTGMTAAPLWLAVITGLGATWAVFWVVVVILRWWLKRGGRWDGQGDLFNLVAASWLVADVLGASLTAFSIPPPLTLPLWLYSVWVGANALSGAIPRASLGYCIGGIVIGLIPAILVIGVISAALGVALAMLGIIPPPGAGPTGIG